MIVYLEWNCHPPLFKSESDSREAWLGVIFSNFENDYNPLSSNKKGFNTHPKRFA
jgi:hypothetical protein